MIRYGIIETDENGDHFKVTEDGQLLHKVRVWHAMGPNVQTKDIRWIPTRVHPTLEGAKTSGGALDPGTWVFVEQDNGERDTTYGTIVGVVQGRVGPTELQGNLSLSSIFQDILSQARWNVLQSRTVEVSSDNSVQIYAVLEETEHKLEDIIGFAEHNGQALFNQSFIPQLLRIPSALQKYNLALSSFLQVPGTVFSLGSLGNTLTSSQKSEITQNMPSDVQRALDTLLYNIRATEGDINGTHVDLETFINNVIELLKDVETVAELINVFIQFLEDENIQGKELLENVDMEVQGPFGNTTISMDSSGNVTDSITDIITQAISLFFAILGAINAAEGTLFDTVQDMQNIHERIIPSLSQDIQSMISRLPRVP